MKNRDQLLVSISVDVHNVLRKAYWDVIYRVYISTINNFILLIPEFDYCWQTFTVVLKVVFVALRNIKLLNTCAKM